MYSPSQLQESEAGALSIVTGKMFYSKQTYPRKIPYLISKGGKVFLFKNLGTKIAALIDPLA